MLKQILALSLVLSTSEFALSHGDEPHDGKEKRPAKTISPSSKEKIAKINELYVKSVKPIFKAKCLDCHGSGKKVPWYYSIPGPKHLMDYDMEEAKEHMDMSNDFPFAGHGSPKEDLEELEEVIKENEMPPWYYKAVHWSSSPSEEEKKIILEWISESLKILSD